MAILAPVQQLLDELHTRYAPVPDGEVATYIPELAKADPDWFGIAVVALNGCSYSVGDADLPFTIQSISKPFVYGLALEDNGEPALLSKVGLEPTGDAFNAISLDPRSGRPSNPMINAGAIATASMVKGGDAPPVERMLAMFASYTGHGMQVDEAVYRSESETGHRNRAIGHLLRNFDIVSGSPEDALDLYFRQCSVSVTCRDLAVMASCLANGGVNPITGERTLERDYVDRVLSIMGTCGMYDYAGEWIYRIGMPAKSGVSGGILAVLPGQLGIGVFSPRLDARGNSVRGVLVCDSLSTTYGLHMLNVPHVADDAVRSSYDLASARSKRQRRPEMEEVLAATGQRAQIYELQGDLNFASAEAFSRDVVGRADGLDFVAIDFKRVRHIDSGAAKLLVDLLANLLAAGKMLTLADAEHHPGLAERTEQLAAEYPNLFLAENRDRAVEWCEDLLIEREGMPSESGAVPLEQNAFFAGLDDATVAKLCGLAKQRSAKPGEKVVSAGQAGECAYLLVSGEVSVTVDLPGDEHVRLATHAPGTAFAASVLLGERVHDADICADTDVEYYEISKTGLEALGESDPRLLAVLYRNIARNASAELRAANAEIRVLSS